jgi:hypothetical protein
MRSPHCPGSGRTPANLPITDARTRCCPVCRRWLRLTRRGTLNHHVATLRTTAKLRDDARGRWCPVHKHYTPCECTEETP